MTQCHLERLLRAEHVYCISAEHNKVVAVVAGSFCTYEAFCTPYELNAMRAQFFFPQDHETDVAHAGLLCARLDKHFEEFGAQFGYSPETRTFSLTAHVLLSDSLSDALDGLAGLCDYVGPLFEQVARVKIFHPLLFEFALTPNHQIAEHGPA